MKKASKFLFNKMDEYVIFHRPYLQEFLDYIFKNYNVSIWTAASKDYALFIINKIILQNNPNRKIDFILFRYHCDLSDKHKGGIKNLKMLWDIFQFEGYTKHNTVILDDFEDVYNLQPNNCIAAVPFEFVDEGSEKDKFLKTLIPKLRKLKTHIKNNGKNPAKKIN